MEFIGHVNYATKLNLDSQVVTTNLKNQPLEIGVWDKNF